MQYTSLVLSVLAFISLFKWSDAKRMSEDEARRKLYTLAELLDAEIAARQALIGNKQPFESEKPALDRITVDDEIDQLLSQPAKQHHRLVLPIMDDDLLYPASNAKRSSNLLRLANQSARGFGK